LGRTTKTSPKTSPTSSSPKLSGSLACITNFISKKDWGTHPSTLRPFVYFDILYSYYDYIDAWTKFMLFQTSEFNHFWFIKFDKISKELFLFGFSTSGINLVLFQTLFLNH
jgi:hypothetical protein